MRSVISIRGECIDDVLYRTQGSTKAIESVIAANPHILATAILPPGTRVYLPEDLETKQTATQPTVNLWD